MTIPIVVGKDRRLILDLPPSTPLGPAEVVIRPRAVHAESGGDGARERIRAKLLAAGLLSSAAPVPPDAAPLSDEDLERLGRLAPGARPSEALIDEDRGAY